MNVPWRDKADPANVTTFKTRILGGQGGAQTLVCRRPETGDIKGVVIFCHGLGADGTAYDLVSEEWAALGYLVVHPTFPDAIRQVALMRPELGLDPHADLSLWMRDPAIRAQMHEILHTPAYWLERVVIAGRVADAVPHILRAAGCTDTDLPMAIAGHSFGAYTAQLLGGAEIDLPAGPAQFRDERYCATLILSGQGRDQQGLRDNSWQGMSGPVLTVTGTRDGGAKGQDWHWKCEPFDLAPPGAKYLAVIADADHYLGGMSRTSEILPDMREALALVTAAFLDAHVLGCDTASTWLSGITDRIANCDVDFRRK